MDNASVHTGNVAQEELNTFLSESGVELVLLPTYSPELHPCELVFAQIKHFVRSSLALLFDPATGRETVRTFDDMITAATDKISRESMAKTYEHCSKLKAESQVASVMRTMGIIHE